MYNFLWDLKPDKIIQDYYHGGLKMLDIELFIHSLKCSWIKRIKFQPDSKLIEVYETMLNTYSKQFVFKCNINTKETEKLEIKSKFKNKRAQRALDRSPLVADL